MYKIKRSNWVKMKNTTVFDIYLVEFNNVTFKIDYSRSNILNT